MLVKELLIYILTYSGSLYNTFKALLRVLKTSYNAFLLSVILAGSPKADERLWFEFT